MAIGQALRTAGAGEDICREATWRQERPGTVVFVASKSCFPPANRQGGGGHAKAKETLECSKGSRPKPGMVANLNRKRRSLISDCRNRRN